ncbi:MAG: ABC transporter substrate-binding protein [Nanoarchaeota archaeon]
MKYPLSIFFIAILLILACTPKEETLNIGGLFALTNYGSSWGVPTHQAVQMAIEEANAQGGIEGKQIRLITEDTRTDPTTAIAGFQKLTDINQVQVIIGPTWDQSSSALAPLADKLQVLMIAADTTGSVEEKKDLPYFFSVWYPEKPNVEVLQDFAKKRR